MSNEIRNGTTENGWLGRDFFKNQQQIDRKQLLAFSGRYIAWSWDGSQILESDLDEMALLQKLEQQGIDTSCVVIDYIPAGDESNLS